MKYLLLFEAYYVIYDSHNNFFLNIYIVDVNLHETILENLYHEYNHIEEDVRNYYNDEFLYFFL